MTKTLEDKAEYEVDDAFSEATAEQAILRFRPVGQSDQQSLAPVLFGVAVLIGAAILLYASSAGLLPAEQRQKDPKESVANIAAVPITGDSLRNSNQLEKIGDALKTFNL